MMFLNLLLLHGGVVFVSTYVSKEFRVRQTPSSSILLVKMLAKMDVVSKTVS